MGGSSKNRIEKSDESSNQYNSSICIQFILFSSGRLRLNVSGDGLARSSYPVLHALLDITRETRPNSVSDHSLEPAIHVSRLTLGGIEENSRLAGAQHISIVYLSKSIVYLSKLRTDYIKSVLAEHGATSTISGTHIETVLAQVPHGSGTR